MTGRVVASDTLRKTSMTYSQDPGSPNVRRTERRPEVRQSSIGMGTIIAIAVALIAGLSVVWYVMADRTSTASVNSPAFERSVPDSTTGQGSLPSMPGRDRPSPTPPAPTTPAR